MSGLNLQHKDSISLIKPSDFSFPFLSVTIIRIEIKKQIKNKNLIKKKNYKRDLACSSLILRSDFPTFRFQIQISEIQGREAIG